MRDISKNIRLLRIQKKLTQDQLSELLCVTRQTVSNYETGKSRPDIDMLLRISEVLGADIHQLIYGVPVPGRKKEWIRVWVCAVLIVLLCIAWYALAPVATRLQSESYNTSLTFFMYLVIRPTIYLLAGYIVAQLACMALNRKPLATCWSAAIHSVLLVWLIGSLFVILWIVGAYVLEYWLYMQKIGGSWIINQFGMQQYEPLRLEVPLWVKHVFTVLSYRILQKYYLIVMPPLGAALCLFRFPERKKHKENKIDSTSPQNP